jgi:hypothetical protein
VMIFSFSDMGTFALEYPSGKAKSCGSQLQP